MDNPSLSAESFSRLILRWAWTSFCGVTGLLWLLSLLQPGAAAQVAANGDQTEATRAAANEAVVIRVLELTNFCNCGLTNAVSMGSARNHPNNLKEFPSGQNLFGGVPFAVRGMIQLGGIYKKEVRGIPVQTRTRAIHLLHGTAGLTADGTEVARLVLHFEGEGQRPLPIVYGEHVRDWWKWKKNEDPSVGEHTEVAWTGGNQFSRSKNIELRVYRSTFANPLPDKILQTIDIVRAPGSSCTPFVLGLTVEETDAPAPSDVPKTK